MRHFAFLFAFLLLPVIVRAQLTINVISVPQETPEGADIYIAGNFNDWNPGDTNYILTDGGNGTYSITFTPSPGQLEYKFTLGSWETVEGNASGGFRPNRVFVYSGGTQIIEVTIDGWEGLTGMHSAANNVMVMDVDFYMPQLDRTRRIWIYLPPDYHNTTKKYPVIYMHDGQNLFDKFYSFAGEWKVDESMNDLFYGDDYGAIVIGIDNGGGERINEYSPWINPGYGGGDGELYAAFIVETLKPYVDTHYRTLPDREYTAIAGSSLGANISMYAGLEHQDVFSKIGIFSPAFWFSDSIYWHISNTVMEEDLRIYFVAGDNESTTMVPDMIAVHDSLLDAGIPTDQMELLHHPDGAHSEWYWAREYPDAYQWLFDDLILNQRPPTIVKHFIYPNPANKFIQILTEDLSVPYKIYSPWGDLIKAGYSHDHLIDIEWLPAGFYLMEIKAAGKEYYINRFIKQ